MTPGRIRLLPDALLSVPVISLSSVWAVIVQLAEGAGRGEGNGSMAVRLTLLVGLQALMFAFP